MLAGLLNFLFLAGLVVNAAGKAKTATTSLLHALWSVCLCALVWWGFGAALAFDAFPTVLDTEEALAGSWIAFPLAAAGAGIVIGAMVDRISFAGVLLISGAVAGLLYPVATRLLLRSAGTPVAAVTAMHLTGGIAGLSGATVLGPRVGRYSFEGVVLQLPGQSPPLQALGLLLMLMGAMEVPLSVTGIALAPALPMTVLGAASGGLVAGGLARLQSGSLALGPLAAGMLSGIVSVTAGLGATDKVLLGALIGGVGGMIYHICRYLIACRLKADDLDAFAIHGACGLWGLLAGELWGAPLFAAGALVEALVAITALSLVLFAVAKAAGGLRQSAEEEEGLYVMEHGLA